MKLHTLALKQKILSISECFLQKQQEEADIFFGGECLLMCVQPLCCQSWLSVPICSFSLCSSSVTAGTKDRLMPTTCIPSIRKVKAFSETSVYDSLAIDGCHVALPTWEEVNSVCDFSFLYQVGEGSWRLSSAFVTPSLKAQSEL